ncbi:MAG: hypothetical protein Q4B43_01805 [Bacteroidota bacterium]|nr:hypothetical protein [Bacteroidota bacterium]
MLSIHLQNTKTQGFECITYEEEAILHELSEQFDVQFITKLWEGFYDDPVFSLTELSEAQSALFDLASRLKKSALSSPQLHFVYKLIATVSYALHHQQNLCCLSD